MSLPAALSSFLVIKMIEKNVPIYHLIPVCATAPFKVLRVVQCRRRVKKERKKERSAKPFLAPLKFFFKISLLVKAKGMGRCKFYKESEKKEERMSLDN